MKTEKEKETQLKIEINHIFDSGVNEIRIFNLLAQQLAERDKEIKEKDLLIKHWRNRFDHAESQLNDKTKSYSGILNWLEVTLSAESKLGASDEILNAYLTVKNYIQSLPQQQDSKEKLHTEVKEAKKQIKNGETLAHEEVFPQEQEPSEREIPPPPNPLSSMDDFK